MTEQIPLEVLDAIREAMEETARRLAKDKGMSAPQPPASQPTSTPDAAADDAPAPGTRPRWRFI